MKYLVVTCIVVLIALQACTKVKHQGINSDLAAAFDFNKGSYWIYRDSLTGQIDSFYEFQRDFVTQLSANKQYSTDQITMHVLQSNATHTDYIEWHFLLGEDEYGITWFNKYGEFTPLFKYPYQLGGRVYSMSQNIVTNVYPSYTVNSQIFNNVVLVNDSLNGPPPQTSYWNDWFYIAANVGIIKMKLYHPYDSINRVWELQSWHIVK
ncbi:MAG: hypothetical protein H0X33_10625 [Taibaiella sp.]|nr:hypothetical protein [Taibaiella sp.]